MQAPITVLGARHHNLKDLTCEIPRYQLVALAGPSGAGKSTLAFDVLFAEGQRRYFESLSAQARSLLALLPRPDVDSIEGLSATIAVRAGGLGRSSRSTLGTATEVADYLRLLFARFSHPYSPETGEQLKSFTVDEIVDQALRRAPGTRFLVMAPLELGAGADVTVALAELSRRGFVRARVDGEELDLSSVEESAPRRAKEVSLIVDRLVVKDGITSRLTDSVELALKEGSGHVLLDFLDGTPPQAMSPWVSVGGRELPAREPALFSENSPHGACPRCNGTGHEDKGEALCAGCGGARLRPEACWFKLDGATYSEMYGARLTELLARLDSVESWLPPDSRHVAQTIIDALRHRIRCLVALGLGYLAPSRSATSLSGGEAQRVSLAAQLGSRLVGGLYLIDEPTAGLHARDVQQVLRAVRELVDYGNTVLVISHDLQLLRAADHILELGPGPGAAGGRLIASGTAQDLALNEASVTGPFLRTEGNSSLSAAEPSPALSGVPWLKIRQATTHNLKNVSLELPLRHLIVFTGVSGSGKSSLVFDTVVPALRARLRGAPAPGPTAFEGLERFDKVLCLDQRPISLQSTSCPATYTGLLGELRTLFGSLPTARARGFKPARFTFNVRGGRCEACKGAGQQRVEMDFLPDAFVGCPVCAGRRFNRETLEVRYRGYNIADILDLSVDEAAPLLSVLPKVAQRLRTLQDTGLGHLRLGQAATTLSGGEAQRLKLAAELAKPDTGDTLYVLDEPTVGLHMREVDQIVDQLILLRDRGNTVMVVEHHPRVVERADWLVELGPGAGDEGGRIIRSEPAH